MTTPEMTPAIVQSWPEVTVRAATAGVTMVLVHQPMAQAMRPVMMP